MAKKVPRKGRPSLTKKDGRTPRVSVSADPASVLRWEKAAAKAKLSLSAWLRSLADAACGKSPPPSP